MKKLPIKFDELIEALTTRFDITDGGWYLDTATGELLLQTDGVEDLPADVEDNTRYLAIEPIVSHDAFQVMADFVASLGDAVAVARLRSALGDPKPFRGFKDALLDFPVHRQAWFAFEREAQKRAAQEWCEENAIEPEWQ
jgi:hypothetical protein